MQFSSKAKLFFNFFLHFWNVHHILDILKKKMSLIADLFPKLLTARTVVI